MEHPIIAAPLKIGSEKFGKFPGKIAITQEASMLVLLCSLVYINWNSFPENYSFKSKNDVKSNIDNDNDDAITLHKIP